MYFTVCICGFCAVHFSYDIILVYFNICYCNSMLNHSFSSNHFLISNETYQLGVKSFRNLFKIIWNVSQKVYPFSKCFRNHSKFSLKSLRKYCSFKWNIWRGDMLIFFKKSSLCTRPPSVFIEFYSSVTIIILFQTPSTCFLIFPW